MRLKKWCLVGRRNQTEKLVESEGKIERACDRIR